MRLHGLPAALLAMLLAGCLPRAGFSTTSGGTTAPPSSPATEPEEHGGVEPHSDVNDQGPPAAGFHATIIRGDQIRRIVGMPVEQAKAELAKLGFEGKIFVSVGGYAEGCKMGTVCRIEPGSAVFSSSEIIFYVNGKLEISAPP